jgi:hypothetical protein
MRYVHHSVLFYPLYAENNTREIIVINYDDIDTTNIEDDRMKALIRVGYSFDFFNINKNLISDIEKNASSSLACPNRKSRRGYTIL